MLKHRIAIGLAFALLLSLPSAYAQKATEIFIPIGASPGLSGEYTKIGPIEAASALNQSVTTSDPSGSYTVRVVEGTKVWLDKSKMKATSEVGGFADLLAGRTVEVKFRDNDPDNPAEWIKVQIAE